ncbi:MAG: hypothetical protein R3281_04155 [Balneolaceae bacterium]|nr:hypothetical protein [Balneolaceae bacterium]
MNSSLILYYAASDHRQQNNADTGENSGNRTNTRFKTGITHRQYQTNDLFLLGGGNAQLEYFRNHTRETANDLIFDEQTMIYREIAVSPQIGIGYGRVRNVTPVIRAVRLDERLSVIEPGTRLNRENLLNAAEHFIKYPGYLARYDWPKKISGRI